MAQEQYTQTEAERGAGMTKETYRPAHAVGTLAVARGEGMATETATGLDPDL